MKRARMLLQKLLHPQKWILLLLPPLSFAALVFIFASENTESAAAYGVYCMSAYSLILLGAATPACIRKLQSVRQSSKTLQKLRQTGFYKNYTTSLAFRGSVGIYQGMAVNFLYVVFRIVAGVRYASAWFISMAAYYLLLGVLRAYLIACYRRRDPALERRCYRRTAWLLFLLNIPMGSMILLMVRTNAGYSYPGSVIYLSALYTFYTMTISVLNLVRYRRLGNPLLSAAKVLNFVSAMMSVLGLQTAMIAQFSEDAAGFRKMMNSITGGVIYSVVILTAIYMLLRSKNIGKEGDLP